MNRKALDRIIDGIIDTYCTRTNLNPVISAKGGERETAMALLGIQLKKLAETLLTNAGAPAPVVENAEAA